MAGKNDLGAAKADEVPVQDDVPAVDETSQVDGLSEDELTATDPDNVEADQNAADANEAEAEQKTARESKPTMGGNTNPADFSVFDEQGNFVEKRDR